MASPALLLMGIVEALELQVSEPETINLNLFPAVGTGSSLIAGLKSLLLLGVELVWISTPAQLVFEGLASE